MLEPLCAVVAIAADHLPHSTNIGSDRCRFHVYEAISFG